MGCLGCRVFKMWDVQDVGCSGCGMFEMWDVQDVGCSVCGMFGMWHVRDVGCLGCGMFAGMWDVEYKMPFKTGRYRNIDFLHTRLF